MYMFIGSDIHTGLIDCTITPLVLEHILLWSHLLWGEFGEYFAALANCYNSAFLVY